MTEKQFTYFDDGKLDGDRVNAVFQSIYALLLERDKEYLAAKLAMELVNQEVLAELDEVIQPHREKLETARSQTERLKDQLIDEWDSRRDEWLMGVRHSHAQRRRRRDKPASDACFDEGRNARIRRFHQRLLDQHEPDATKQTAEEFGLSARQINRILKI